jgi:hypothetical protein
MKKTAFVLFFLFAIGALTVFEILSHLAPSKTAQLLPNTTVALVELPDIATTLQHWHGSALEKMSQQPEAKSLASLGLEWLSDWSGIVLEAQDMQKIKELLTSMKPGRFFAAMVPNKQEANWIVGCQFFGSQKSMDKTLDEVTGVLDEIYGVSIHSTLDPKEHQGEVIKQRNYQGLTFVTAFHDNWIFLSNDVSLLQTTLDFSARRRHIKESLSVSELYQKNRAHLFSQGDFFFYLTPSVVLGKIPELASMLKEEPRWSHAKALGSSFRCAEKGINEQLFFSGDFKTSTTIAHEGLRFTEPSTLIYAEQTYDWKNESSWLENPLFPALVTQWLTKITSDFSSLIPLLKPTMTFELSWKKGASLPTALLAAPEKNSSDITLWLHQTASHLGTSVDTYEKNDLLTLPLMPESSLLKPVFASFQGFFLLATEAPFVEELSSRAPAKGLLKEAPDFDSSLYKEANEAFFYIATQEVVEHLWSFVQPLLSGVKSADTEESFQLPPIENISKYLSPITIAEHSSEEGFLIQAHSPCGVTPLYLMRKLVYTLFLSSEQSLNPSGAQDDSEENGSTSSLGNDDQDED